MIEMDKTTEVEYDIAASSMQEDYSPAPEEVLNWCVNGTANLLNAVSDRNLFVTVWESYDEIVFNMRAAMHALSLIEIPEHIKKPELYPEDEPEVPKIVIGVDMPRAIHYQGYAIEQMIIKEELSGVKYERYQYEIYEHGAWVFKGDAHRGGANSVDAAMELIDHEFKLDKINTS